MRSRLAFAVALSFAAVGLAATPVLAQKQGGTLRIYHRDNLPSASIHEEATIDTVQPFMGVFNNLVALRPDQAAQHARNDRAGPRGQLGLGRDQHQADLQAASGREVARRQAVHRQGRAVHLEQAHRQGPRRLPQEPARHLVAQPQGGHRQRRPGGHLRPQPAAALVPLPVRLGLHAGLPLPCLHQGHAHQPDRHGALQVRRVQARRLDQVRAQPGLLEEGQALRRRHRVEGDREPVDAHPRLRRRRVRHDVRHRRDHSAAQGRQVAGAKGRVRGGAHLRLHQPDHQSECPALQRSQDPPGHGAHARPARPTSTS